MIGVLIATYKRHEGTLPKTLKPLIGCQSGYRLICAYDGDKAGIRIPIKTLFAEKSWKWQVGERKNILRGFKWLKEEGCAYAIKLSGDGLVEKPEKIAELADELNGCDLVCSPWGKPDECIGTMVFFGKMDPLLKMAKEADIDEKDMTWVEKIYGTVANRLGIRWKHMPEKWWREKIGFRHLHIK